MAEALCTASRQYEDHIDRETRGHPISTISRTIMPNAFQLSPQTRRPVIFLQIYGRVYDHKSK